MTIPAGYEYNAAVLALLEQAIVSGGGVVPGRGDRGWNAREEQLLRTLEGITGASAVNLAALTDWLGGVGTWIDPGGTHLSGTPVFSSGWTLSLLGGVGTSVSDPFDGAHLIGSAMSTLADGTALTTSHCWSLLAHLLEQSPPASLSSDINIAMGICDEAADSVTINASFIGMLYTGGTRQLMKGRVQAGVVTSGTGSANAGIRGHLTTFFKEGNDSSGNACLTQLINTRALDVNGEAITAVGAGSATDHTTAIDNFAPRPFLAAWRSSTTDGTTRAVGFRARRALFTSHAIPTS